MFESELAPICMQLTTLLAECSLQAAGVNPKLMKSVTKCVRDTSASTDALKAALDAQLQQYSQLVGYLKGVKTSTTVCFRPVLDIHMNLRSPVYAMMALLSQCVCVCRSSCRQLHCPAVHAAALWPAANCSSVMQPGELFKLIHSFAKDLEQAMWEVAAAETRAAQKPATAFLRSPSPSPGQLGEPQDQLLKDSVIKQMQAFCRLSPGDRRAALSEAACSRKDIPEKLTSERPHLPKGSLAHPDRGKLRPSTVRSRFSSSVHSSIACWFTVDGPLCA